MITPAQVFDAYLADGRSTRLRVGPCDQPDCTLPECCAYAWVRIAGIWEPTCRAGNGRAWAVEYARRAIGDSLGSPVVEVVEVVNGDEQPTRAELLARLDALGDECGNLRQYIALGPHADARMGKVGPFKAPVTLDASEVVALLDIAQAARRKQKADAALAVALAQITDSGDRDG